MRCQHSHSVVPSRFCELELELELKVWTCHDLSSVHTIIIRHSQEIKRGEGRYDPMLVTYPNAGAQADQVAVEQDSGARESPAAARAGLLDNRTAFHVHRLVAQVQAGAQQASNNLLTFIVLESEKKKV